MMVSLSLTLFSTWLISVISAAKFDSVVVSQSFFKDCHGAFRTDVTVGGQSFTAQLSTDSNLSIFSPCSYNSVNATKLSFQVFAVVYDAFLQQCRIERRTALTDQIVFLNGSQPTAAFTTELIDYNQTSTDQCCPPSTIFMATSSAGLMATIGNDKVDTIAFSPSGHMTIGKINPDYLQTLTVFENRTIPGTESSKFYYAFNNYSLSLGGIPIPFDGQINYAMATTTSPFMTMKVNEFELLVRRLQLEYGVPLTMFDQGALRLALLPSCYCLPPIAMTIDGFTHTFSDYVVHLPQIDIGCVNCNACLLFTESAKSPVKYRVLAFAGYSPRPFSGGPPLANPQYQVGTFFWSHFETYFLKKTERNIAYVAINNPN